VKITIFGGGGFIGSHIADRLLKDNHSLRIFERPRIEPYRKFASHENVQWLTGDLMSVHDVSAAIDGVDAVMHLVSTTLPKSSNEDPIFDVQSNLVATLQLLDAMVLKGVKKIVFISSGGTVYGRPQYLPIDENHPTDPRVSYGITKLAIEKYMLMYQELHGIKVNILRVGNPFGQRQRIETAQGAVGIFLNKAIQRQPIEIWGDGSVTRDYIFINDVANAFAHALVYDGAYSVFNISSGVGTSLNDLIVLLERVLGRGIERNFHPGRAFDMPASVLSNNLAQRELQWAPQVSLEAGVRITVDWIEKILEK
jgi:UDP-glucose 4-epimerase